MVAVTDAVETTFKAKHLCKKQNNEIMEQITLVILDQSKNY